MEITDRMLLEGHEFCIHGVVVVSGIRPYGRTVDQRPKGRGRHGILYLWNGAVRFSPENAPELCAQKGDLVVIPKGCRYYMQYIAGETTFVLVNFEMTSLNLEPTVLSDRIRILAHDSEDRRFAGIMAKLEMCSAAESRSAVFRRKELVYRLFSKVFEETAAFELRQTKHAHIVPGVLLLQQTYLENLPISRFAEACNVSVSSFRALFGEQYGMSPIQYRNKLRIDRARSILTDGSCTVSEAAYASGFENIGYFCRYYKKLTGETPRETQLRDR